MGIREEGQTPKELLSRSIDEIIKEQARYLPDQGPLSTFISQNSLQAFEHIDFHDALVAAREVHKANGYLPLTAFQGKFREGEIREDDLTEALSIRPMPLEGCPSGLSRARLVRGLLFAQIPNIAPLARDWYLTQGTKASPYLRALFQEIGKFSWPIEGAQAEDYARVPLIDLVGKVIGGMMAQEVRRMLAQLSAVFLDRGAAIHSLPGRKNGFFQFALNVLAGSPHVEPWLVEAASQAREILEKGEIAENYIERTLAWQQPDRRCFPEIIRNTLLAHPGWAGMFWRLQRNDSECPEEWLSVRIEDFLAIQLLLERKICLERSRERFGREAILQPGVLRGKLTDRLADPARVRPLPHPSWHLLFALVHAEVSPDTLAKLTLKDQEALVSIAMKWSGNGVLSVWQEAYEASYRRIVLGPIAQRAKSPVTVNQPTIQLITCIDDREESFRRACEELDPTIETFGAAGFFGIPVQFTPLGHARHLDLCPLNVKAVHRVTEKPATHHSGLRHIRNKQFSLFLKQMETASRVGVSGSLFSGFLGLLVYPAMVVGLLFPRVGEKFGSIPARMARGGIKTRLEFEEDPTGIGSFPLSDQVARLAGLLENAGLTKNFAPLVVLMGHGSTSVNNPHKSAYDCGACGGNEGAASARIFASLINRPDVRKGLAARGIVIPDSTVFVGCLHDTANEAITFHEGDVPDAAQSRLVEAKKLLRRAARANARERCRRFHSAPRILSDNRALRHVQGRSADLGQARPELGHCTTSLTIIGRRKISRGVFLDRRAFLISYNPDSDPKGTILERMIAAVGPVVAGISLQYYFSRVENQVFGCGTKLPHNPVGLLGVQEGAAGDLRIGLPKQAVEIHTPIRQTILLETTREIFLGILECQAEVSRLVNNAWVRVVVSAPDHSTAWLYLPGIGFREINHWYPSYWKPVARVSDSPAWYLGHMEDLPPAFVETTTSIQANKSEKKTVFMKGLEIFS